MKRKRGESTIEEEDQISKCVRSSIEEHEISKCEGSSIQELELSKWGEPSIDENDRISKFADEIIHHILSFMDMIFAVRTCLLSKRWRYMGTSLPTIKLDYSLPYYGDDDHWNKKLVRKALKSRNNYIQRLHVNLPMQYKRPIHRWIRAALEANVEDICICYTGEETRIPKGTFLSESLKKLVLVIPHTTIELPKSELGSEFESLYLPRLEYLKLDYIPSMDEEQINKLVSSCPVIEYLDLMLRDDDDYGDGEDHGIRIASPTLKHLKIRKYSGRVALSLYAPKLVSLSFESATNNIYLEDVSSLVNAKIVSKHDGGYAILDDPTIQKTSLNVLCNVQCLTIPVPLLQDIPGIPEFLERQVPEQFGNLRELKLLETNFSWSSSVFIIASFLSMSPNIESLTLEITRGGDWESTLSQNELKSELETLSVMFTLNKLKIVMVSNFQGSPVEMKLLEILLKKTSALEKLDIFANQTDRLAVPFVRAKISDDLISFRKNSGIPGPLIINFDTIGGYNNLYGNY